MAIMADSSKVFRRKRQAISVSAANLVLQTPMEGGNGLPLVIQPAIPGVALPDWLAQHRDELPALLHTHGGLLFRGFGLQTQADFSQVIDALGLAKLDYIERATPRTELGGQIYTATEFPPEYPIAPHNELSYVHQWPGRICFFCETPAQTGGETPIVDVRRVLKRIDPAIVDRFRQHGWMLVRNFAGTIGPTWQHCYDVDTVEELEAYCAAADIKTEWLGGGRLRTSQVRPAVRRHPVTGEELWFNHISFWHVSSLPDDIRIRFSADFGIDNLPYNTYYGDGSPIPADVAARLRAAYDAEMVSYPWQTGDFAILDNMLVAHGRATFTGKRRVLVSMGDPVEMPASIASPALHAGI